MFTLLSGKLVHDATHAQQAIILAATRPPMSLSTAASQLPAKLVELVDRALAFDKAGRWSSAAEMRDAIQALHQALFGEAIGASALAALAALAASTAAFLASDATAGTLAAGEDEVPAGAARTLPSRPSLPGAEAVDSARIPAPVMATSDPVSSSKRSSAVLPLKRRLAPIALATGILSAGLYLAARSQKAPAVSEASSTPSPPSRPVVIAPPSPPVPPYAGAASLPPAAPAASSAQLATAPPRPARPLVGSPRHASSARPTSSSPPPPFDPTSVR